MELIPRPDYIEKIAGLINRGMMLILTGQRRVGKSKVRLFSLTTAFATTFALPVFEAALRK